MAVEIYLSPSLQVVRKTDPRITEVREWQSGTPKEAAWYLVAILYESGMGTFQCASWDADYGWSLKDDNIIGYIPINALVRNAKLEWPEHLMPKENG